MAAINMEWSQMARSYNMFKGCRGGFLAMLWTTDSRIFLDLG